jgi:enoyl-CoA hydratase/carnithine racemase
MDVVFTVGPLTEPEKGTLKNGIPEVKECLIPSMALYRLPRLIGAARAREMILTGEPISADRAADYGLINQVVPAPEFPRALDTCIADTSSPSPRPRWP